MAKKFMIKKIRTWRRRFLALKHMSIGKTCQFHFSESVTIIPGKNSLITVTRGFVRLGNALPNQNHLDSKKNSTITLGTNAKIEIHGNLFIGPGASIAVGNNASLIFFGENYISNDFNLIVNKSCIFHEGASISWGVTMIDDDQHAFRRTKDSRLVKLPSKPLILKKNSGIEMNVTIPRGITVGENSMVLGATVLRGNVPDNTTVYQDIPLKQKYNLRRDGCDLNLIRA